MILKIGKPQPIQVPFDPTVHLALEEGPCRGDVTVSAYAEDGRLISQLITFNAAGQFSRWTGANPEEMRKYGFQCTDAGAIKARWPERNDDHA